MGAYPNIAAIAGDIARAPLQQESAVQQIAAQRQEAAMRAQAIEAQRRQFADQDALTKALTQYDPSKQTLADIPRLVSQNGGSGQAALKAQAGLIEARSNLLKMSDEQFAQQQKQQDLLQGVHDSIAQAPAEQKQQVYQQGLAQLQSAGVDVSKEPPQYPGDQAFAQHLPAIRLHSALLADAEKQRTMEKEQAEATAATARAGKEQAETAKTQAETKFYQDQGLAPGVTPEMAAYAAYIKKGGTPENYKAWQAQNEANATLQSKVKLTYAEANARQQAAQGDPAVAGKMLADGSLTLADLKTRGTTPQFIEKAAQEAQKINPNYKPSDEIVAETVAKSQSANQFFGSANSLINKGGTLDQLEELGKKLPQHSLPALNTIDDWQKAARGNGPLAAYAATALGVADDYGKVMGGGTASDHARDAALSLFSKAASPEQRSQAIQATRNAVMSQRDSRIGNNQFLKRQYGSEPTSGASTPQGRAVRVNGKIVGYTTDGKTMTPVQ